MSELKVGLVGVGRWGAQHIVALERAKEVQGVALCANTAESAAQAAARWNLPCDSDYTQFLTRPEIEAVIIAAPNYLHPAMAQQALRAGKHVLVEKPMAFNHADADALLATAAETKKVLFPGHEFRFFTLWERFKQLLDEGAIGTPRFGSLDLWRYPYSSGSGGWRRDPAMVGDWLLEEPIHYFDLAVWFMQHPPTRLYAASSAGAPERAKWHENFSALLTFENGSYVNLSRTVASHRFRVQIRFTGSEGSLEGRWNAATDRSLDPVATLSLFRFGDEAAQMLEVNQATGHAFDLHREIEAFAAATRGEIPAITGLDGRRAVYLCEAASQSLETGQAVQLEDWK